MSNANVKELLEKYPFLRWWGDPLFRGYSEDAEPSDTYTWQDEVPEGWRKAFCPQMWEDLKVILEKANFVNNFRFNQIKEKFGELRLYFGAVPDKIFDEVHEWSEKYLYLSRSICIKCGKPAKYQTVSWISPWCEDCAHGIVIELKDMEDFYNSPISEREKFIKDLGK